jgi:ABC-type sugar transport system substrate-binding protein
MIWSASGILCAVSGGLPKSSSLLGRVEAVTAMAQTKPTIPIIVKDTTSFYWQTVLAGARKAGRDLGVDVAELGAQSESDIDGQIAIFENAVASNPAAIVIAPAQFDALGKPIDKAAKKVKIIGINSAASGISGGRWRSLTAAPCLYCCSKAHKFKNEPLPALSSLEWRASGVRVDRGGWLTHNWGVS